MSIESIISPASVAVLGASNRKSSVGGAVMANIISGSYTGKLYPVNPSHDTIQGLKCYKCIVDIEYPVDLATIRVFDKVRSQGRIYVQETEAMEVLKSYGFHIPISQLTTTEDECAKSSEEIGYPVVLKVSSPNIVHKTDVGGVELNLKNSLEVQKRSEE